MADKASRRLARVLESTQDLVIFANLDFTVSHLNEAARKALEMECMEYSSFPLSRLVTEKGLATLMDEGFPAAKETGSWRGELAMQNLNASRIPVLLELLAHRSLHGDIEYFSLVAHDLTEKKAAEDQLKQYQAEIDHASRLVTMGELASSLAHELNQPLSAMVNYLRGIERRFADKPTLSWSDIELPITRSIRTALRAGEIIHRMMDFTRKQEPVVTRLNLPDLIGEMINFCESTAERHNVSVVFEPDLNLPDVKGDRVQLEQVVLNLIVNAVEASASADRRDDAAIVRVRVAPHESGQLRVEVEDQGRGISEVDMSRLFDRFFSTKETGLGMGLAISRSLVENLGGELWAENLPTGGARFSFTLNITD
jgi:two-component system sensor kinase FixL